MQIEVALPLTASTKEKGDLLEALAKKMLEAQSYTVIQEIRFTAVELDLLCRHKVSGKEIYVECKAHRANLDANILKNLLGTLTLQEYSEAWIISTAQYGKEAKGFIEKWKARPQNEATRLSFYSPEMIIEGLIDSKIIMSPPTLVAGELAGGVNYLGDWTLLVTPYGNFWAVSKLSGGVPTEIICFYSDTSIAVVETPLLQNLANTDTTLAALPFVAARNKFVGESHNADVVDVAQIQSGDAWNDYRPARPVDFVGRRKEIESIFTLLKSIATKTTKTRVFSFTGNSGMGKSSLIAKITARSKVGHSRKKYFVFPVDVRAASSPSYIYSALLQCLVSAQRSGFGESAISLNITDATDPLKSISIREFLTSLEINGQIIVLVLDQFEELYTKPELFHVFDRAKSLLLAATSFAGNFCLGFAWKSDSTTHHEHPAYFFWHELADYRLTQKLSPFSDSESASVINIFEKQVKQKLNNDLRHNLMVSSQGYPWLLKKLCIHLYDRLLHGAQQRDLLENKLDVKDLFDSDLNQLSAAERTCLDFVARRAPVDWFEVIETSSADALNSLINRRLVIRSGDRLNVYWDIFREYLLTQRIPLIPLRYLPATDFTSIINVVTCLPPNQVVSLTNIAKKTGFEIGTIQNIGTALNMFGIATRADGGYQLAPNISNNDPIIVARMLREKFKKHVFTLILQERSSNLELTMLEATSLLKEIYPNSTYADKTWEIYTNRLCRWLELCGFLNSTRNGWVYRDRGDVNPSLPVSRRRASEDIFYAPTSPATVIEAAKWLQDKGPTAKSAQLPKGYRNAFAILNRFEIIVSSTTSFELNKASLNNFLSIDEAVWAVAETEASIQESINFLRDQPTLTPEQLGDALNTKLAMNWSSTSKKRVGGGLRQWATWIMNGKELALNSVQNKRDATQQDLEY